MFPESFLSGWTYFPGLFSKLSATAWLLSPIRANGTKKEINY
jgi:hypothetical protein